MKKIIFCFCLLFCASNVFAEHYIVKFEIRQQRTGLDIFDLGGQIKDAMNAMTIEIPVEKEYFDSVKINQNIEKDFRMGSLLLNGSFSNWIIKIKEKRIQN